jgi:hypothetical protein
LGIRFTAREFRQWSRRQFMLRVVHAMVRDGALPDYYRDRVRDAFHRLICDDDRLRRLVG